MEVGVKSFFKHSTGEKIIDLATHSDSCSQVCFNFDGSLVCSGGLDGKVFVYKTEDGTLINTLEGPTEISVSVC
jgi:WD40 repeat protein